MKTVYKYILEPDTVIDMPEGAVVLCVHAQDNGIHLWALVDNAAPLEKDILSFLAPATKSASTAFPILALSIYFMAVSCFTFLSKCHPRR
jgi:hypothetical protein